MLPSCIYGAVIAMLRSVGALNLPISAALFDPGSASGQAICRGSREGAAPCGCGGVRARRRQPAKRAALCCQASGAAPRGRFRNPWRIFEIIDKLHAEIVACHIAPPTHAPDWGNCRDQAQR
jgi:hypothetical protein